MPGEKVHETHLNRKKLDMMAYTHHFSYCGKLK
jgi:hypothetical protein